MNLKKVIPLGAAVVLGLLAAEMVVKMAQGNKGPVAAKLNTASVVVLKQDVPAGESLTNDDLTVGEVSAGTASSATAFHDPAELLGRVTTIPLIGGQVVTESLLAPKGSTAGITVTIPPGMRAMTVEIDEFSGVAYFLAPGNHVDILHTMREETTNISLTKTIVQNVQILAVGQHQNPGDQPSQAHSVTLLVTPAQAEAITLAAANGRPRFTLRNSRDNAIAEAPGINIVELMGSPKQTAPPATPVEFMGTQKHVQSNESPTTRADDTAQQDIFAPGGNSQHAAPPQLWSMRVINGGISSSVSVKVAAPQSDSDYTNSPTGPAVAP